MVNTYFKALRGLLRVPTYLLILVYFTVGFLASGHSTHWLSLGLGAVIIAAWYINATSINDLKDFEIDQINLKGDPDRPLVTGALSRSGLAQIAVGTAVAALALASAIGWQAVILTAGALIFNYAYSMPPFAISRLGGLALALLPAGYVGFSLALGSMAGAGFELGTIGMLMAFSYFQFLARISLKDYRDVVGDAKFGKRTFLLRHGSEAVVRLALSSHILASVAGIIWIYNFSPLVSVGYAFLAAISGRFLWQLRTADQWQQRRIWIMAFGRLVSGQLVLVLLGLFYRQGMLAAAYQLPILLIFVLGGFVWSSQIIIFRNSEN